MQLKATKYRAGETDTRGRSVGATTIRLYVTGTEDEIAKIVALGEGWAYGANINGRSLTTAEAYCVTPAEVDAARAPLRALGVR